MPPVPGDGLGCGNMDGEGFTLPPAAPEDGGGGGGDARLNDAGENPPQWPYR
jgi:hypothetical protein